MDPMVFEEPPLLEIPLVLPDSREVSPLLISQKLTPAHLIQKLSHILQTPRERIVLDPYYSRGPTGLLTTLAG